MADPNAPQNNAAPQTPPPAGGPFDQRPPANLVTPENPEAKTMGMLAHLLVIFTGFIGPLVIWLVKKDQSPFVNQQGKEALNWGITISLASVACAILTVMFLFVSLSMGSLIGKLQYAVWIVNIVFGILSTMEVNKGNPYRYPVCIRFIK